MNKKLQKLQDRWHKEVFNRGKEIDSGNIFNWEGILLGFLLGAGLDLETAEEISIYAPNNGWKV